MKTVAWAYGYASVCDRSPLNKIKWSAFQTVKVALIRQGLGVIKHPLIGLSGRKIPNVHIGSGFIPVKSGQIGPPPRMRKLAARNVLMPFVTHNFLEDMALVLCVAALATVICQLLRQPLVVGDLIAGMVVGPHVPGVHANLERVRLVSDLGVTALVFAIGLEFNLRRLVRLARTAGSVALIQAAWMIWLGYLVGRLMGWTPWESPAGRRDRVDIRRRHRGQGLRRGAGGFQGARTGLRRGAVPFCPAGKYLRRLECAPSGGHLAGLELTRAAGLSEDESHGQTPLP